MSSLYTVTSDKGNAIRGDIKQIIKAMMSMLTDNERLEIIGGYCKECGCENPKCACWNDE